MRILYSCPPWIRAKAWPLGSCTKSLGESIGALSVVMRSSLRLAKSAKSPGSLVSDTDEDTMVETTRTSGSWLGQQLRRRHLLHAQHDQGVEVAGDLAGLGLRADARLHVRPGLGIGRDLKTRAARLVQQRDELVADQLVELVGVDRDAARQGLARQAPTDAELVETARYAGQVGEHGVAHRCGHLVVGQGVQPDVDDGAAG